MFDLIIVGGGPAGSHLAALVAGRGHSVLVCERSAFPRDKLCGEFLSPEVLGYLEETGSADRVRALGGAPIRSLAVFAPRGRPVRRGFPGSPIGLNRRDFDDTLRLTAIARGAEWRTRRVLGVARSDFFDVTVEQDGDRVTYSARAVVDAGGRQGISGRAGRRFDGYAPATAVADLDGGRGDGLKAERGSRRFVAFKRHYRSDAPLAGLEMYAFRGGYCGVSPISARVANVCLLIETTRIRVSDPSEGGLADRLINDLRATHAGFAQRMSQLTPIDRGYLSASGFHFDRSRPTPASWIAVGDAAGEIAPVCGDGIAIALRSAALAARALYTYLDGRSGWEQARAAYAAEWRREFARRRRLGAALQEVLLRPRLAGGLLWAARRAPVLADLLIRGTRDGRSVIPGTTGAGTFSPSRPPTQSIPPPEWPG